VLHCNLLYCTYIHKPEGRTQVLPTARRTELRDCIYVTHCSHMWCNRALCIGVRQHSTKLHCDDCPLLSSLYLEGLALYFDIRNSSTRWPLCSSSFWTNIWILVSSKALQRPWKLLSCHSWSPYISFEFGQSYWH